MTRHLAGGRESSYVSVTDFLRFCYLNIPYLRINITLIFMSSSSDELTSKTQKKIFLLVSDSHICAPQRDTTNLGVCIQGLKNLGETFFRISRICIIAQTWFMARLTAFFTLIFFHFPDSGLSLLTGLLFYFWWRDNERCFLVGLRIVYHYSHCFTVRVSNQLAFRVRRAATRPAKSERDGRP